jgi:hypothetical protein
VAPAKRSKRVELQEWLAEKRPAAIAEPEFAELMTSLAPISEGYLRKLLRDSGTPLTPMIAGVRQSTLDELEASLLALLDEYEQGDPPRRAAVRRLVITAKDHARWASRKPRSASSDPSSSKPEMILWMITWLENPPLFRDWVKLRRKQIHADRIEPDRTD